MMLIEAMFITGGGDMVVVDFLFTRMLLLLQVNWVLLLGGIKRLEQIFETLKEFFGERLKDSEFSGNGQYPADKDYHGGGCNYSMESQTSESWLLVPWCFDTYLDR
eukprot:Blabericola_migrator_1__5126@NODE_264_length_10634_cov_183_258446_g220_i0_p11_GENE_NODE_264_length_10634_cov_183_258446_g220_i0NODE_264_length_10634_cov_183_258446_g220_i0_p11_ORF_typecomplete_len106_score4_46HSP70/PF00012_20/0_11_NODE_264_length_10634_cov_183_258446_g220_i065136830